MLMSIDVVDMVILATIIIAFSRARLQAGIRQQHIRLELELDFALIPFLGLASLAPLDMTHVAVIGASQKRSSGFTDSSCTTLPFLHVGLGEPSLAHAIGLFQPEGASVAQGFQGGRPVVVLTVVVYVELVVVDC